MAGSRDAGAVGRRRRLIVTKIFVCFSPLNNGSIGHAVRWRWTTNLGRILQFVASLYDKLNGAPLVIASTTLIGSVRPVCHLLLLLSSTIEHCRAIIFLFADFMAPLPLLVSFLIAIFRYSMQIDPINPRIICASVRLLMEKSFIVKMR